MSLNVVVFVAQVAKELIVRLIIGVQSTAVAISKMFSCTYTFCLASNS